MPATAAVDMIRTAISARLATSSLSGRPATTRPPSATHLPRTVLYVDVRYPALARDGVDRGERAESLLDRLGDGQAAKLGVLTAHDLHADRQTVSHPGWHHRGRDAEQVGREDRAQQLQGGDRAVQAGDVEVQREGRLGPDRAEQYRVLLVPQAPAAGQPVPGSMRHRPAGQVRCGQVPG